MNFTLFYEGNLKANGSTADKQALRRGFLPQIKVLLETNKTLYHAIVEDCEVCGNPNPISRGSFSFIPIVSTHFSMFAAVSVTLLRPGPLGRLVTSGGDLDNCLKTLLDSLSIPPHDNQIPSGDSPSTDERPFYCVLEDDCLIQKVSIESRSLLREDATNSFVVALIDVSVSFHSRDFHNLTLS